MPILLTGGTGQVGAALRRLSCPGFEVYAPERETLDLRDYENIATMVASRPWRAVINSGAYTAVDRAETETELAWTLNAGAPAALAEATARADIPLIHLSTDFVFPGTKSQPYLETDPVGPVGVYGASKAAGEMAVQAKNPKHLILRTAWVVSPDGSNFIKTMLRLADTRDEVAVVNDQIGCPTSADDLAAAVRLILARLEGEQPAFGICHLVNSGEASWHDLARAVFDQAGAAGRKVPRLTAIPTSQYPTPARRPANSRLDTAKLTREFGLRLRPWQEAVRDVVTTLLAQPTR
ncbi:MAG: dTDP-4-dehydrorhamnose reductase [Phenylobacterium zucineum]|nr:MAG: dTDP-4-dehydrorhamnose reductase [Phenylobacterium zucineum]